MPQASGASSEVISCGIDWLTVTAPSDGRDVALIVYACALLQISERLGNEPTAWRWNGYDGRSMPGLAYGLRKDGAYLRLSGEQAHDHWHGAVGRATNVTRLDTEVTVVVDAGQLGLAERAYRGVRAFNVGRERPLTLKKYVTPESTETADIGSRASPTFGRVYDKAKESKGVWPAGSWRYEVETKAPLAAALARRLSQHADARTACLAYVFDWFSRRGVVPAFSRGAAEVRVARFSEPTNDQRRLKWLAEQVQPVVAELGAKGLGPNVLLALGIGREAADRWLPLQKGK